MRLVVTFQRFDNEWNEYVDLEEDEVINDKDKLKVVVSPSLSDTCSTEDLSEVHVSTVQSQRKLFYLL